MFNLIWNFAFTSAKIPTSLLPANATSYRTYTHSCISIFVFSNNQRSAISLHLQLHLILNLQLIFSHEPSFQLYVLPHILNTLSNSYQHRLVSSQSLPSLLWQYHGSSLLSIAHHYYGNIIAHGNIITNIIAIIARIITIITIINTITIITIITVITSIQWSVTVIRRDLVLTIFRNQFSLYKSFISYFRILIFILVDWNVCWKHLGIICFCYGLVLSRIFWNK